MRKSIRVIMAALISAALISVSLESTVFSVDNTAVAAQEQKTENGIFTGGAEYIMNMDSGILIIDGEGSFTADEFNALTKACVPNTVVFGKGVSVPKNENLPDSWMMSILGNAAPYNVYTYKDSDSWVKYQEVLNYVTLLSASDGKILARGYSSFGLPAYTMEDDWDPYEIFSYSNDILMNGRKMIQYLIENGIEENRAAKITSFYLMGLKLRVEMGNANPDGTELNAATLDMYRTQCLECALCEQDLANSDEEFTNFTNPLSKFLAENGITGDQNRISIQQYTSGTKMRLAQAREYKQEEPTVSPIEDENIDAVIARRLEIMREKVIKASLYSNNVEYIDLILPYYEAGLRLRIKEGLASQNGEEANRSTNSKYVNYCLYACNALLHLDDKDLNSTEREFYTKQLEYYENLLSSDYTVDTEDSEGKYITDEGHFVKYTEFTENEGLLHEGLGYHYDPETKGMYLDGDGVFGEGDAVNIEHGFDIKFFILGKDLKLGSTLKLSPDYYPDYNLWLVGRISDKEHDIYFYQGSHTERLYDLYINRCIDEGFSSTQLPYPCTSVKLLRSYFAVTRLNDNIDPYTVLHGTSGITPTPKYSAKAIKEGQMVKAPPTLTGDADLNGVVGLSDITAASKHVISDVTYPLINLTAISNADMNGDGIIDGIDVSGIIEINLGLI